MVLSFSAFGCNCPYVIYMYCLYCTGILYNTVHKYSRPYLLLSLNTTVLLFNYLYLLLVCIYLIPLSCFKMALYNTVLNKCPFYAPILIYYFSVTCCPFMSCDFLLL